MRHSHSEKLLTVFLVLVAVQVLFSSTANAQGRLGRIRDAVREKAPAPAPASSHSHDRDSRRDDRNSNRDDRESRVDNHQTSDDSDDRRLASIRNSVRSNESNQHSGQGNNGQGNNGQGNTGHNHDDRRHNDRRGSRRRDRNRGRSGLNIHASSFTAIDYCDSPAFYPSVYGPAYYPTTLVAPVQAPEPVYAPAIAAPVIVEQPLVEPVVAVPVESVGQSYFEDVDEFDVWTTRLTLHGGYDFDSISQAGLSLLLQAPGGPGIDTSINMLRESGTDWRDFLWVGDLNLVYEFAGDRARTRVGVGLNWLGDSYGGEAGINLTAGTDLQLTRLLTLSGEVDFGSLADADLFHSRISLSRKIATDVSGGGAEFMVGYDYYDIGGTEIGSAITGLTFRF